MRITKSTNRFSGSADHHRSPHQVRRRWKSGARHELEWWKRWLRSRGGEWPEDYAFRVNPRSPLAAEHAALLSHVSCRGLRVLDVGCGPLTVVGKTLSQRTLTITAIDAFADEYNALLASLRIAPPVAAERCQAEAIGDQFPASTFHLVNARNCLDHMYDPIAALDGMLKVLRPRCYVFLTHAANEGGNAKYHGLHQWDLSHRNGRFLISRRGYTRDVTAHLLNSASVTIVPREHGWFSVKIRKRAR